ncbi:MAG: SDR family NAD(P)-dependent oxidoreductase [Proteobacteria bacterium]|nr:SDR family NAD(P)-dependent oxidoreductase [Pseudomonadota bacterium]
MLADWKAQPLNETVELVSDSGVTVSSHIVDVSSRSKMEAFAKTVSDEHRGINLLFNNAGLTVSGSFREQSLGDWERVVGVNLWGVIYGCKLFMPLLEIAEEAHIINISSVFGIVGIPSQSSYCATKYAVRGLSETLWEETRDLHIGVSVVHPGGVGTNIVSNAKVYDGESNDKTIEFFKSKTMKPSTAARVLLEGVRDGKPRILVTREAPWIDRLKRMFPVWGNRRVADGVVKMMGMGGKRDEMTAEVKAEIEAARAAR